MVARDQSLASAPRICLGAGECRISLAAFNRQPQKKGLECQLGTTTFLTIQLRFPGMPRKLEITSTRNSPKFVPWETSYLQLFDLHMTQNFAQSRFSAAIEACTPVITKVQGSVNTLGTGRLLYVFACRTQLEENFSN